MKQFLFLFLLLSIHIAYAQQAYHISSGEFKCISDAAGIVVSIDDKNFSVGPALNEKRLTYTELNPAEFTRLKSGSNTISANDMIRDLSPGQLHSVKFSCTYPDASEDYCLMFNKFLFASFRKANSEEPAKFDKLSPFAFIEIDGLRFIYVFEEKAIICKTADGFKMMPVAKYSKGVKLKTITHSPSASEINYSLYEIAQNPEKYYIINKVNEKYQLCDTFGTPILPGLHETLLISGVVVAGNNKLFDLYNHRAEKLNTKPVRTYKVYNNLIQFI